VPATRAGCSVISRRGRLGDVNAGAVRFGVLVSRRKLAALLAIAGAFSLATPARSALTSLVPAEQDPAQVGPVLTPADQPTLSAADAELARQVVRSDRRLSALLGDTAYSIADVGLWNTSQGGRLGAFVVLRFDKPTTITGRWPTMRYDRGRENDVAPYEERDADLSVQDITELQVLVNLRNRKIAAVIPPPSAHVIPGPTEHPTPPPPGQPD
jgi:hypothetical protein